MSAATLRQKEAQKRQRADMRDNPSHYNCVCGNVGYIFKSGEIVCRRCHEWELAAWAVRGDLRGYAERRVAA